MEIEAGGDAEEMVDGGASLMPVEVRADGMLGIEVLVRGKEAIDESGGVGVFPRR